VVIIQIPKQRESDRTRLTVTDQPPRDGPDAGIHQVLRMVQPQVKLKPSPHQEEGRGQQPYLEQDDLGAVSADHANLQHGEAELAYTQRRR
jgi:hypothetical protein